MNNFSIKFALRRGWDLFKNHYQVLALATLIFLIIDGVASNRKDAGDVYSLSFIVMSVAVCILWVIVRIGWIKLALLIEDGNSGSVKELFKHGNLFWKFLLTTIAYGALCLLGLILFIIPGFYFALKYQFVTVLVIDKENMPIKQAFKESARMTRGSLLKLIALIAVISLFNALGALFFIVGLLVTVPVSMLAYLYVYRTLERMPQQA